jgi:hypothetical protein
LPAGRAAQHRGFRIHGAAVRKPCTRTGTCNIDERRRTERVPLDRTDEHACHRRRRVSRSRGGVPAERRDRAEAGAPAAAA